MRPIKFRIWDKIDKRFLPNDDGMYPFEIYPDGSFLGLVDGHWEGEERFTLVQFTGLLDKNGKEIYANDIVYARANNSHGVVKEGTCYYYDGFDKHDIWGWYIEDTKDPSDKEPLFTQTDEYLEVIGNIYSNPELLEGE